MPRQLPDTDFKIHVDESCLSAPMDDEIAAKPVVEEIPEEVVAQDEEVEAEPVPAPEAGEEEQDDAPDEEKHEDGVEESADITPQAAPVEEDLPQELETADAQVDEQKTPEIEEAAEVDDDDTPRPSQVAEDFAVGESRRESSGSPRKTSLRTEALIQAAARDVVARIEAQANDKVRARHSARSSGRSSRMSNAHEGLAGTELTYDGSTEASRRNSIDSHLLRPRSAMESAGEGGDSSSQHEIDDDVFSDGSPRSSLGSYDAVQDDAHSKSGDTVQHNDDYGDYRRSPRVSGISHISQYETEEFVPTARGTPRPVFRTPSAVRALQMSSPPPSVFSSPRSSKRHTGISTGLPSVSRLGSPTVSAQYSPKGRSTPPRFKTRKETPLVLLHTTLLPLRWVWADVLSDLDNVKGLEDYETSEQMKTLRASWRQLQDRVGDTVLERGVLLPHPQNDFEVLEERLLEALELPLRRRARILECGHYLGPSNEMTLLEDEYVDSDDEFASLAGDKKEKRHWCGTCRGEIRFDELGVDKIFRVKVYASNGLMRAGAWEACWKEMERIDAEIEPIVDAELHKELEKLAVVVLQEQQKHRDLGGHETDHDLHEDRYTHPVHSEPISPPMPTSPAQPASVTVGADTERRLRDEARLREIYGHTPPPHDAEPTSSTHPHPDSYIPPPTPPSPSEQAYERRETRRRGAYQTASLPELLLESARVVFRDRKNVAIALLSLFVLMLAVRTAPPQPGPLAQKEAEILREMYARHQQLEKEQVAKLAVDAAPEVDTTSAVMDLTTTPAVVELTTTASVSTVQTETAADVEVAPTVSDPCASPSAQRNPVQSAPVAPGVESSRALTPEAETVTEKKVVRIVETITETETVKATATATEVAAPPIVEQLEKVAERAASAVSEYVDAAAPTEAVEGPSTSD